MKTDLQDLSLSHLSHRHVCDMPVMHACMQCAAKASSTEGARLSDGMRRNSSQIECFSVQVVRCSGTSVEGSVHMHQAEYHAKKNSEKRSEQRRLLVTSSPRPCARYLVLRRWSAEWPRTRGHPSGRAHPRPGARAG